VTTLVLTPRFTDDSQLLWRAAGRIGWNVKRLQTWRVPEQLRNLEEPVLYAEALFGPTLAEQLGVQIENPPEDWLPNLPEHYRKRSVTLSTLSQARLGTERAFIKPPNDKSFPAQVYQPAELPDGYDEEMSVLISEVVTWENEFRCFVLDRELQTFSIYARFGELQSEQGYEHSESEEHGLRQFLPDFLADSNVHLPKATVIDVGWITGKGWAVVEQNAAWGAGIYACDPEQCLKVIRHASRRVFS
jgi:ATP-grasp domain, R2K clade family 2